jgi:hypothetical protein
MTLVELLLVVALLGPVLLIVVMLYTLGERVCSRSVALLEAQEHGRIAMEEMVHELQYAHRVSVDGSGAVLTYDKKVNGVSRRYRFYRSGWHLLLDLPEGTAVPLAAYVEELYFEPAGRLRPGEMVTLAVTVTYEGHSVVLRSRVMPRNVTGEGL